MEESAPYEACKRFRKNIFINLQYRKNVLKAIFN